MSDNKQGSVSFPRGFTGPRDQAEHRFDFSFSGLKTAVARWIEARTAVGDQINVADVAAAFQEAVVDVLVSKALAACAEYGVAANSRLRELAAQRADSQGVRIRVPRPNLCTDNGAMVAALGSRMMAAGVGATHLGFGVDSCLPVETTHVP